MLTPLFILKKFYGYDFFRPNQENIINHILSKQDCLAIMPTSAGKSICYQIPALIFPGITIVISPLIALMKDQVDSLNKKNIPAVFLNSTLSFKLSKKIENELLQNKYKILYVSPEKIQTSNFQKLCSNLNVSMIAVDEAHCISQWGYNFRPNYLKIPKIIPFLKYKPVIVAFTATATNFVKKDIIKYLNLQTPFVITSGFDRPNLTFKVLQLNNKNTYITNYLIKHFNDCGIIYCSTRKNVDQLYFFLRQQNFKVSRYHGGMNENNRNKNQIEFLQNKTNIMIATNAFGMGVDKSNVRFVIHYNLSKDVEGYYQEAGRAGRDGKESECILLFSYDDIIPIKALIDKTSNTFLKELELKKLNDMIDYCKCTTCLREFILNYFGEKKDFVNCNKCSNCMPKTNKISFFEEAKMILECIKSIPENHEMTIIIQVLKGLNSPQIKTFGLYNSKYFGLMNYISEEIIKKYIYELIKKDYIKILIKKKKYIVLTKKSKTFFHSTADYFNDFFIDG